MPGPAKRAYPQGFISGRVVNGAAPEAGVWVIAETKETNTPFIKIVVTDDQGRYTLPELPEATYNVWVRGYGLRDSVRVKGRPGDTALELKAETAKDAHEAAKVYPGDYWLSLLQPPSQSSFPAPVTRRAAATASRRRCSARTTGCTASRRTATSATSSARS